MGFMGGASGGGDVSARPVIKHRDNAENEADLEAKKRAKKRTDSNNKRVDRNKLMIPLNGQAGGGSGLVIQP